MIKGIFSAFWRSETARFAMRGHFLASCAAFAAAGLLWQFSSDFINLHIFWFLDIAMGAAYCGFLLTALPAWQGFSGSLRALNCSLLALLALSAASASFSLPLAAAFALVFWLLLLAAALFIAFCAKDAGVLHALLLALIAAKIAYFASGDLRFASVQIFINAAAVNFISFKISAAITRSALDEAGLFEVIFIPSAPARNLSVLGCLIAAGCVFASEAAQLFACAAAGCFMLARLRDFASLALLKTPYIAGFATLLALIAAGFFAAAFLGTAGLHLLAIFSVCGMIFAVFCIAGRRHFGLPVRLNLASYLSAAAIAGAAILRGFLPSENALGLSAWLLGAAFALELAQLARIMRANRFIADG